jgi:hypothetical protein
MALRDKRISTDAFIDIIALFGTFVLEMLLEDLRRLKMKN